VGGEVVASDGAVGGGGAPGVPLRGWAVALDEAYAEPLRSGNPCVVGRIEQGRLLLDLRCVPEQDDVALTQAATRAVATARGGG
jgi:L-seryl-tRNA(Ser) seleniumtransferase